MGKAKDFKAIADTAHKSTIDALLQIAINGAQAAAKKNLYSVSYTYPKHQADALIPLLESEGFRVTPTFKVLVSDQEGKALVTSDIMVTIDFSAPAE